MSGKLHYCITARYVDLPPKAYDCLKSIHVLIIFMCKRTSSWNRSIFRKNCNRKISWSMKLSKVNQQYTWFCFCCCCLISYKVKQKKENAKALHLRIQQVLVRCSELINTRTIKNVVLHDCLTTFEGNFE